MNKRMFLKDADPAAFETMLGFEQYLAAGKLNRKHAELIKIRVSQLNGCAYCLDKHIADALKYGESPRRIYLLSVWRETHLFSEEEKAILALAEAMTFIAAQGVPDNVYDTALQTLGQSYLTTVMMAIIAMNAWNRVGITTGRHPQP